MGEAVTKTMRILASSKGKAARHALMLAVASPEPVVSLAASREVLAKNNVNGIFELVRQFDRLTPEQQEFLTADTEKLAQPLRMALINGDSTIQENAVAIIKQWRPYSLIPLLLNHLEQGAVSSHQGIVQWAVNFLVDYFTREFQGLIPRKAYYSYTLVDIIDALEKGFATWRRHERQIFIDIFFRLSERFDGLGDEAREMIANANHPAHAVFIRKLTGSQDPCVMRFLLRNLESTLAPSSVLIAVARRTDRVFIRLLLESVGYQPSIALRDNLAKIRRFEWFGNFRLLLDELGEEGHHRFLVELVRHSGLPDHEKMIVYENILRCGKRQGKVAVVELMRYVTTSDGDRFVMQALDDEAPEVQAVALSQLRTRKIRNSTARLLQYVDSPHERVRKTLAGELPEFRLDRMLPSLGALSSEQQSYMISVIKKIDPNMRETIARELENSEQRHKDFLLDLIAEEKTVTAFETSLMKFVEREQDIALRLKAIKLLALGVSDASYRFLQSTATSEKNHDVSVLAKRICEIRDMVKKRK